MIFGLIIALAVLVDQLTKFWTVSSLSLGERAGFIPGILGFTYTRNSGAAFGMMYGFNWIFLVLNPLLIVLLCIIIWRNMFKDKFCNIALALIVGGAVGNMVDRIRLGYVIDMVETLFVRFPIFNVADICITVGGVLFFIAYIRAERRKKREGQEKEQALETEQEANG